MNGLYAGKQAQVQKILEEKQIDLWLLMGRETVDVCDPALRLVFDGNVMGVSAFFFTRTGKRLALVRRQDVSGVEATGCFDQVTGYGDNFDQLLRQTIEDIAPNVIDINADLYDALTDGLTTGLYLRLLHALEGTPYAQRLSLGQVIRAVRGRKIPEEIAMQVQVLKLLNQACDELKAQLHIGMTEGEVYDFCQAFMKEHDMTGSWDMGCCPLVHAGARSNRAWFARATTPSVQGTPSI